MNFLIKTKYTVFLLFLIGSAIYINSLGKINLFGIPFVIFGTFLYCWGCITLGPNWSIDVRKSYQIVREGPFKYVRHPLYLGFFLICLGFCIYRTSIPTILFLIFVGVPFGYFKSKYEEKLLEEKFEEYREYKKETGAFFPKF